MRKLRKIILCILGVILVGVAAVTVWQWQNLTALRYALTMSDQRVEEHIAENDRKLKDVMDHYQIPERVFSKEELEVMTGAEAEAEVEKATEALLQEPRPQQTAPVAEAQQQPAVPVPKPTPEAAEELDYSEKIRGQIAKMYVLKATYIAELERVVRTAKAEYLALPEAKRSDAEKQAVVMAHAGELSTLEAECDRKVAAVVTELRRLLKADGQDGATADLIETTYANEKSLKKAYYVSKF